MGEPRESITIEQPAPLRPVHVWRRNGEMWACCAYDHGPFCRLCQPVDDTLLALLQNVAGGAMECKAGPDGEFKFKVTALGKVQAEELISTNPEMTMLWAQLQERYS